MKQKCLIVVGNRESGQSDFSSNWGAGCDGKSLAVFQADSKTQLYKLWNQTSSSDYRPHMVSLMEIEKRGGGLRTLGISTIGDLIGQTKGNSLFGPDGK